MTQSLSLAPWADLRPIIGKGELVALNVGSDANLYTVIALQELDDRFVSAGGASFVKTNPRVPPAYRVVAFFDGTVTLDVSIPNEPFSIHGVQPLPNNELLLVCSRSSYRGRDDFDRNGRIYTTRGRFVREILLGDGIQCVQATTSGVIWTSYFDEGIFGNCGWDDPVGSSGLAAWDALGNRNYEYEPTAGLDHICDCYALNIESESSAWLYYYTDFPLVHLRNRHIESWWSMPLRGSSAFAVSQGLALFAEGYEKRCEFHLFELERSGGRAIPMGKLKFIDEFEQTIDAEFVVGRADALYMLHRNQIYRCEVSAARDCM